MCKSYHLPALLSNTPPWFSHHVFDLCQCTPKMTRTVTTEFLRHLIAAVSYKLHTSLTDNGVQFTNQSHQRYAFKHLFDRICSTHGIEHRLTKPDHPWTNGQVERMNRTQRCYCAPLLQLST